MLPLKLLLLYCRAGFEAECAAEISNRATEVGIAGYPVFTKDQGYVEYHLFGDALELMSQIKFRSLIFIRQWVACLPICSELPTQDRISPLSALVQDLPQTAELVAETPDTTEGRELQGFVTKFASAFSQSLRKNGLMLSRKQASLWRLHLFALSGKEMFLGVSPVKNSSRHAMGIQRLKFPSHAPSRSTLKLEEAWHWFIPKSEFDEALGGGLTAVDLGAAPGGWTWQLVQKGMFVTAVDNGPMNESLMETGQVTHLREDAFRFEPVRPVNWMVCDVVEKPIQVTELMLDWAINGWAEQMVFNLKLPMKQRYKETLQCLDRLKDGLNEHSIDFKLSARHLYHDREEITCYLDLRKA